MDKQKEYLDKVVDRLVSETIIDFDEETLYMPFFNSFHAYPFESYYVLKFFITPSFHSILPPSFTQHCRDVYGLIGDEIDYVWNNYKTIINNKISDGR